MTEITTYYDPSTRKHPKETYTIDEDGIENGKYLRYYENGEVAVECTFKDGKVNGKFWEYHQNGELKTECNYKQGQLNGPFAQYRENGTVLVICGYVNDTLCGSYSEFHNARGWHKRIECFFLNGRLEGRYKEYFKNGAIHREATFSKGKLEGPVRVYSKKSRTLADGSKSRTIENGFFRQGKPDDYWVYTGKSPYGNYDQSEDFSRNNVEEYQKRISKLTERAPGHAEDFKSDVRRITPTSKSAEMTQVDEVNTKYRRTGRWKDGHE